MKNTTSLPRIRLSRVHAPVTTLGPGARLGIWFQGCTIGCPGCVSRDTWPSDTTIAKPLNELLAWIDGHLNVETTGITLSGGEPSEQPEALAALLRELLPRRWERIAAGLPPLDVLCYTGLDHVDDFLLRIPDAAHLGIDALITGRFLITQPTDLLWRGSANQRLEPLTELGRTRYDDHREQRTDRPGMQVGVTADEVFLVGIPRRRDMQHLSEVLRAAGVELDGVSWRP